MSKKIFSKLIILLSFLAAAILFLLSRLQPGIFGDFEFTLAWAGVLFAGASGLALVIDALLTKNSVTIKKFKFFGAAMLILMAILCLISALTLPENLVLPIILVVIAALLVLGVLITGGKKWDEADNHKVGYKNYYQRKAEEEKQNEKDENDGE